MQTLTSRIAKELEAAPHCSVYEPELDRVWPQCENREQIITEFAKVHGWQLRFYRDGLVAIFAKAPLSERN